MSTTKQKKLNIDGKPYDNRPCSQVIDLSKQILQVLTFSPSWCIIGKKDPKCYIINNKSVATIINT